MRRPTAGHPFLDAPGPLAFAHRGASRHGLENSMTAFSEAVALGYRYLETDVRVTRDGVLVAFHDATLRRTTGRSGRVANLTWAELSWARIGGREPIPLLEDVLGGWPDVRVNLDVKVTAAVPGLAEVLRRTGSVDRVCIGAFSDARLSRIRAAVGPALATSLGPRAALGLRIASRSRAASAAWPEASTRSMRSGGSGSARGVRCAQVPPRAGCLPLIDERFVAAAHRRGMQVHAWTINDRAEMVRLLDLGVDGIMTDRAAVLRDVLLARGQWHGGGPAPGG